MTPKTPTPDYGHKYADKQLAALIKRLKISYMSASIELQGKILRYLEQFEKEDTAKRALFDSGELSHEDYMAWRSRVIAGTKQWVQMREQLAVDMRQQNEIAAAMINDSLPDIYALNHNYGTYEAEVASGIDTTYTLYDKSTVTRLLKEKQDLLPSPSVNIPKDERWNQQHLQSTVLRGILTGNSMQDIAAQFQEVTNMTANAAIRNARTAVTGAENAGRADSYKRAQSMGIKMKQVWIATLDDRTRDSHAMMDGEQVEVGKKFSNGCRYPGDPQGSPEEVFNCRCTVAAVVEGSDGYAGAARPSQYLEDSGMSYDRWRELHGERFYEKLFGSVQIGANEPPKALPTWNPYQDAENGGINTTLLNRAEKMTDKQIRSSVKSLQKRVVEHQKKIEKLERKLKNGGEAIELRKTYGLLNYWAGEVLKYATQRDVFRGIIKKRGQNER